MIKKDYIILAQVIRSLLLKLEKDNPRFDRNKFLNFLKKKEA